MNKIAFVDIETNGSSYSNDEIIEVGILIYQDGKLKETYNQLFKPFKAIPNFIQNLTGIKPSMLSQQPRFKMQARTIYDLIKDATFVAHNVGFDYNFLKHHLGVHGFNLNTDKLCSIQVSKQLFPNATKHNLDAVINNLNIAIDNDRRHRALGDCEVIFKLWTEFENQFADTDINKFVNRFKQNKLHTKVVEQIKKAPRKTGVYKFFINQKCLIVGRSKNLHNRVKQIFYKANRSDKKQIYSTVSEIVYEVCNSELEAKLREIEAVKKLKPKYAHHKVQKFSVSHPLDSPAPEHPVEQTVTGIFTNNKGSDMSFGQEFEDLFKATTLPLQWEGSLPSWPNKMLLIPSGNKFLVLYNYTYLGFVHSANYVSSGLITNQTVDFRTVKIILNHLAFLKKENIIWKDII